MDEEQALASPIAGGIRGIRRSVSSSVFTGRAVAPPPPDPQVTSLLNQNSLTLTSISGQLSNVSAQVGGLNNSLNVIKDNLAISDQLDRQREAAKQRREAQLAEQSLREGKESQLERKIQNALLTPVRRVAVRAQGILGRLGNFLLVLAGGWLVNSTLTFLRLKSEGNVDALNKFKVKFLGTLALMTGIGTLMTVGLSKLLGLIGNIAGTVLRVTFSGLLLTPFKALFSFISKNVNEFRKIVTNQAGNLVKKAPKALLDIVKTPVTAITGAVLSIPLVGPLLRKTGKFAQKLPLIGGLFKGKTPVAGPVQAAVETIGFGFDVRNRVREDKDGDGVGGQTTAQAVAGAGANTIAGLTVFFGTLAAFPELGSSIIGLLGLGILSGFAGGAAGGFTDKITGADKANEKSFLKNNVEGVNENNVDDVIDFNAGSGDQSGSITPTSNSKNMSSLQFSEDANIINIPFNAGGNQGGGDNGGVAGPSGGNSDNLPSINSSDNINNFPALAGSIYNIAEV